MAVKITKTELKLVPLNAEIAELEIKIAEASFGGRGFGKTRLAMSYYSHLSEKYSALCSKRYKLEQKIKKIVENRERREREKERRKLERKLQKEMAPLQQWLTKKTR